MASSRERAIAPKAKPVQASGGGERWWPVALALVAVALMHMALPEKYRLFPYGWRQR
jgi:hypothetical protein